MSDRIELAGTPVLEGRDGFFAAYLNFIQTVLNATANPEQFESSKAVTIALIRIGIAAIPDPRDEIRPAIYEAIAADIEAQWKEEEQRTGKKERSDVAKQRNFSFNSHVDVGLGMMSSWYDQMLGVVTKNSIGRAYALGE